MAVAKRQEARQNRAEHGQREAQDRGEDFRQSGAPAQAVCIGQAQGEKKHIKRAAEGFSLSPTRGCSLSLHPPPTPLDDGVLFSSRLWIDVPSHLEDGFSCYLLNKIEL